jgi:tetratricopeptide (TPR) repeat protein
MLVPAAISAVSRWKYQPFEVEGKPAAIRTLVLIPFGNAGSHTAEDRAEIAFQNNFWTAEDSAEAALTKGDYARTQEQLDKARDLVSPDTKETRHTRERWQWITTMGRLRMAQKKNDEAEQYFKQALALRENKWEDKDSPAIAASLANLAALYAEEKRFALAHDHAVRALAILEKNFRKAGNPAAQQAFGRGIAQEAWLLLRVSKERADGDEAGKQCHTLLEFQNFLAPADRDSAVSACQGGSTPLAGQKP